MDNLLKLVYVLGKNLYDEMPIRQLSREANVPYTTAYRLVKQNTSLFVINPKGNLKLCSLNLDDCITKQYVILAERSHADSFMKKNVMFKVIQKELVRGDYSLVLFGSRSESTHRSKSDIDFCIINNDGKKNISFSKFELLFKVEINSLFFARKEFQLMLEEKDHNVAKEILRNHVILYGEEYFWDSVLEDV